MRAFLFIAAFAILMGSVTCTKDKGSVPSSQYDTIKALAYFPARPGSHWTYDNNQTMEVVGYEAYTYNKEAYTASPQNITQVLPKLRLRGIYNAGDEFAYVNGHSLSRGTGANYRDPAFKALLSLTEGAEFIIGAAIKEHQYTGKTVKVDTSLFIGTKKYEQVIVVIHYDKACGWAETCATVREYYAKGVGLIKREKRNYPVETVFTKDLELVQYEVK